MSSPLEGNISEFQWSSELERSPRDQIFRPIYGTPYLRNNNVVIILSIGLQMLWLYPVQRTVPAHETP